MRPKDKQFETEHASIFADASVVHAYQYRPPYPQATFEILLSLIDREVKPCAVLDAGCGPGLIALGLVAAVERIDAVDVAANMLAAGKAHPGGDDAKLHWIHGAMEDAPLTPPYALIVAAASLHWMHWETVMTRFAEVLSPGGSLAVIEEMAEPVPWGHGLSIISDYSLNKDFKPYSMLTVTEELAARGLFEQRGMKTTTRVPFRQSVDDYIESFHARNGLSRDRMDVELARELDGKLRGFISPYCPDGIVELQIGARVIWGKPQAAPH